MIAWISRFIQFNAPDEKRVWYFIWGTYDTFVWTPLFKFHWRRDIFRSIKAHARRSLETLGTRF